MTSFKSPLRPLWQAQCPGCGGLVTVKKARPGENEGDRMCRGCQVIAARSRRAKARLAVRQLADEIGAPAVPVRHEAEGPDGLPDLSTVRIDEALTRYLAADPSPCPHCLARHSPMRSCPATRSVQGGGL